MKQFLLFSVLSIFCLNISAQTNTWIGTNGNWSTNSNWSLNIVPNQNHDVVIPAGSTVLLNVDGNTKSITLQGNAIFNFINTSSLKLSFTNASTFSAASSFNWSGGTIKGGGTLTLNGTTVITPENTYHFKRIEENTTIINNGTLLQQGNAKILIKHGTLINNPSGIIDLQVDGADIAKDSSPIAALVINKGLIKRTGTGRVDISTDFQNDKGVISVEGGTLRLNGAAITMNNGTYNVAEGAVMEWRTKIELIGTLSGNLAGDIKCGIGTEFCHFYVPIGTSSTFNFNGDGNLSLISGTLRGGGTLVNTGKIFTQTIHAWRIEENSTLTNEGLINMGAGSFNFYINNSTFLNQSNGIIIIQADGPNITKSSGSTTDMFINNGLIKRTGSGMSEISTGFENNNGIISIEEGTLRFKGLTATMTDGEYNVAAGALMEWRTNIKCVGTLTGTLAGDIKCGIGTQFCRLNIPTGNTATLNFTGGGNMTLNSGSQIGGGNLINRGKLFIQPTQQWRIEENSTLTNEGLINMGAGSFDFYLSDGTFLNKTEGVLDLQGGTDILARGTTHILINNGLIKRTTTTGVAFIEATTTNSGTIDVQMGELEFKGNLGFNNTQGGKVMGVGIFDLPAAAAYTNDGIFSPGGYPGTLTVQGDFKSSTTSELQIEIYGPTQGTEFDLLAIQGKSVMDGDIAVALYFAPNLGDEFVVVTSNDITTCNLPATTMAHYDDHNYTFDVICNPTNITLKITNIVLGTEENTLSNLSIYPNPTNGNFIIDLGKECTDVSVQIYNMLGQLISSEEYTSAKNITNEITSAAGVYFVRVSTGIEGSKILRIIKQ